MYRLFALITIFLFTACDEKNVSPNTLSKEQQAYLTKDLTPPNSEGHVFVLHRFDDEKHASTSISSEDLISHFEYLKTHHYHVASYSEFEEKLLAHQPIPANWVMFTIDDTYKSFYEKGLPLFKAYHFPFVLYLYIEATERSFGDFMSWEQLKEASKYGAIGLHSYGHNHMTKMTTKESIEDTKKALRIFKKHLGFTPKSYVYPYGEFDSTTKKAIRTFDFNLIFNQNSGAISHKSDIYDLDRIALTGKSNIKSLLRIKHLPAIWHNVDVDKERMILRSINVKIDKRYKKVQIFVSGGEWQTLKLKEGKIAHTFNRVLKKGRTRIIIKTFDNRWSSKIIIL